MISFLSDKVSRYTRLVETLALISWALISWRASP
jgi:hypothetical protein